MSETALAWIGGALLAAVLVPLIGLMAYQIYKAGKKRRP